MVNGSSYGAERERARTTRTLDDSDPFFTSDMLESDDRESSLVMVIDDSPTVRSVVEISLYRVGIPAVAFSGGLEALEALQSGKVAPPRVLLLDIGIPPMTGYEVAKLLKSNAACAETRIIMLSGHDGVVNRTLARLCGATDFIAKPFQAGELVRRVRRALGLTDPGSDWPS
jgi:DNA-binding response OmpR family regulator